MLGAAVVGLAALVGAGVYAQERKSEEQPKPHEAQADKTADACADCMKQCAKAVRHCGRQLADGKKEYLKCLELCADCMEMCGAASKCCRWSRTATTCWRPSAIRW